MRSLVVSRATRMYAHARQSWRTMHVTAVSVDWRGRSRWRERSVVCAGREMVAMHASGAFTGFTVEGLALMMIGREV